VNSSSEVERQPVLADSERAQVDFSPAPHDATRSTVEPPSSTTAPLEAALERMIEMARCAGAAEERARIHEIMIAEGAHRFPRLAWNLAKTGAVSREQAVSVFAAAETDVAALAWQSPTRH
jgi:hypothetical protein